MRLYKGSAPKPLYWHMQILKSPFILHTNASGDGLGALLYQDQDGQRRVIAYASRSFTKSERNYPVHKLELLALKWANTDKFHEYLYGAEFQVFIDNNPLTYVLTTTMLDATGHRWVATLSNYTFSITYKPGKANRDADACLQLNGLRQWSCPLIQCTLSVRECRHHMAK